MSRLQRGLVAAIGVVFSTVGLASVAALVLVLIGAQLPDADEASGSVLLTAAAALAAAAGGVCCAALLRWRRVPAPRRESFVDLGGGGKHSMTE